MATDLPNVARVVAEGTFDAERFVNVFHFRKRDDTAFSASDLGTLLATLSAVSTADDSLAHLYIVMDSGLVVDTLTAKTLDSTVPIEASITVSLAGGGAGNNMPPMMCCVVKWSSAVATRSARGRTYFCGLSVGNVSTSNSDRLESTFLSDMNTNAGEFVTAWQADPTYAFTVLSEKGRQADQPAPYHDIQAASVNPTIAIQRRRREAAS